MNIVILERASVGMDVSVALFEDFGNVEIYRNTLYDEIAERVKDADIIIANKSKLNEDTLKDAKNVKLICEFATGFDNVNLEYCKKRGIGVCNVRDYCTDMVAQHTFAMAFYLAGKLKYYDDYVKTGKYSKSPIFTHFDRYFNELEGKTWGIAGLGNIGKKVAAAAEAFGCGVVYFSTSGKHDDDKYETWASALQSVIK